jgi:putative DNA primase/helicase
MHRDPVEFDPSHTLIMLTNHLPRVSGDDPAVWRRLLAVPFDVEIPEDERDGALGAKLRKEAPAVLRWAWAGWLDYRRRESLDPPDAVRARTAAYRAASDALGRFLDEQCLRFPAATVRARELYTAYTRWCETTGERAESEREFSDSLFRRGVEKVHRAIGRVYLGIGLASDEPVPAEPDEPREPDTLPIGN